MSYCRGCVYERFPKMPQQKLHKASLMIVGEAPGATELVKKVAFIGSSGELLRNTLQRVNIDVQDAILTNALLCRPPKGRQIKNEAIVRCFPRLENEILQVQPKLILALGNVALHSLTGNSKLKITQEQGAVHTCAFGNGYTIPVVASLHPAKILRSPGEYKQFYKALKYAADLLQGESIKDPGKSSYLVADTEEEVREAIKVLNNYQFLSADFETTGLNHWTSSRILALGIGYEKNKAFIFSPKCVPLLKELFESKDIKWIWHNGKFDCAFLRRLRIGGRVDHDTILLNCCLDETGSNELEHLATLHLGAKSYKSPVRKAAKGSIESQGYSKVPKGMLYDYLAKDVDYTLQLFHVLYPKVKADSSLWKLYRETLIPSSEFLLRVERKGIYCSLEALDALEAKYVKELAELENAAEQQTERLWNPEQYIRDTGAKSAPQKFNPASPKQVAWLLYDKLRLHPRKGKKRSTEEEVIEEFREAVPIVRTILNMRSVRKSLSTYVVGVRNRLGDDQRVHTSYALHITSTGRLSSRNPNVQNIPQEPIIRNVFQAPPGFRLLEVDYKGAELRVLASYSGDDFLIDVFKTGRDLHDEVAIAIFGKDFTKKDRMKAKTINFGIPYGREAYSIALAFDVSEQEAQSWIDMWFERAPKAAAFLQKMADAVIKGDVIVTPFGRKRRFGLITKENVDSLQNEARNFPIQSTTSDCCLTAARKLYNPLKKFNAYIINLVHDSILIEMPDDDILVKPVMKLVKDYMMQVPREVGLVVPMEVEFKMGYRWGDLKEIGDDGNYETDCKAV